MHGAISQSCHASKRNRRLGQKLYKAPLIRFAVVGKHKLGMHCYPSSRKTAGKLLKLLSLKSVMQTACIMASIVRLAALLAPCCTQQCHADVVKHKVCH